MKAADLLFENNMFSDVISEAYYAIFHTPKALLALRRIHPKTHTGVISQFGLQFVTEGLIEELYGRVWQKLRRRGKKPIMTSILRALNEFVLFHSFTFFSPLFHPSFTRGSKCAYTKSAMKFTVRIARAKKRKAPCKSG